MSKEWFVGTSGFMVGQKTWLDLPGLNCIEINSTFYRLPNKHTITKWKNLDPNLFFSIKASKYITHMKRLKNCKQAWKVFWNRVKPLGNKMKAILIQLPPSFKNTPETFERVKKMKAYLPKNGPSIVFEFRDKSWFTPEVTALFKSAGWCLGGTLITRKKKTYWLGNLPSGIHLPTTTNNTSYLRVHGEKGYKKYYGTRKLAQIKSMVNRRKTKKNFIMFNNVFFTKRSRTCKVKKKKIRYAAVCDAVKFARMTRKKKN